MKNTALLAVALVGITACSKEAPDFRPGIDSRPEVRAADRITDSVSFIEDGAPTLGVSDRYFVSLNKTALDKEFLLHANLIPQQNQASSHGIQARVVAFKRVMDKVFLMEANQGHLVTGDLPAQLILAEIPILRETGDTLILDFNQGMRKAFVAGNWYASDYTGGAKFVANREIVQIQTSFIQSISVEDNELEIRQIAQAIATEKDETSAPTYEFRYYLSPYRPNKNFQPKLSTDFSRVGYFEIAPLIEPETGKVLSYISRWDTTKPITYYVSANTPAEYVDAIKEGILYWNQIFGREVLRAEVAPAGVTAPSARHNIIQWVPNDYAGSAYADGLMDPRTGEILHAQVYLTSVFGSNTKRRLPALLRRVNTPVQQTATLGLQKMSSGRLCELHDHEALAEGIDKLIAAKASDADLMRVVKDYLREVVAHEVGHTLGLRHNFAGSLATNVNTVEREQLFRDYLLKNEIPAEKYVFTSSMMEYNSLVEGVLVAAQAQHLKIAPSYDVLAIQWGYADRPVDVEKAPLFCTDSHAQKYTDCVRFDSGALPVVANAEKISASLRAAPVTFVENFLIAKTAADPRDRKALQELPLDPNALSTTFSGVLQSQLMWLNPKGTPSIEVERQFPFASSFNDKLMLSRQQESVAAQIREAGGLETAIFSLLPRDGEGSVSLADSLQAKLLDYVMRDDVQNGIGYDGKPYRLSAGEVAYILEAGKRYFEIAEEQLLTQSLTALSQAKFTTKLLGYEIEERLASLARAIVLAQTEAVVEGTTGVVSKEPKDTDKAASLKKFKYSAEVRKAAAKLLAASLGDVNDWSATNRADLNQKLKALVESNLGTALDQVDTKKLSRAQRQWLNEQNSLLATINATASM